MVSWETRGDGIEVDAIRDAKLFNGGPDLHSPFIRARVGRVIIGYVFRGPGSGPIGSRSMSSLLSASGCKEASSSR